MFRIALGGAMTVDQTEPSRTCIIFFTQLSRSIELIKIGQ
jgi:hypothetical protein